MRLRATIKVMTLNSAGEPSALGPPNNLDGITVGELVHQNLVTDIGCVFRILETKLFQNSGRRRATPRLFKVTTHWLSHVFQLHRLFVDQAQLHGVVAIGSSRRLLLHNHAGTRFDHSYRCNRSVSSEELRHTDFSTDDSVNHDFRFLISDF